MVVTTDAATTTTPPRPTDPFEPGCVEYQRATPQEPVELDLYTFGPLMPEPVLRVVLPQVRTAEGLEPAMPSVIAIPGGVLIAANAADVETRPTKAEGAMLAAVDLDGGVRWVRCLSGTWHVHRWALADEEHAYAVNYPHAEAMDREAHLLSLADGTISDVVVPAPLEPPYPDLPRLQSALEAGIEYRGEDGEVAWRDTDLVDVGLEGQWSVIAGDVALYGGCRQGTDCDGITRAYETTTGRVLWEKPGLHRFGPVADGFALVRSYVFPQPGAEDVGWWSMIDMATGTDVPGQQWPVAGLEFDQGCCGDPRTFTLTTGGVVVHSGYVGWFQPTEVRVYYPIDANLEPHKVDLP
ncbi:MAG: hypothetical protein Q7V57_12830 [Actinomycetota bacterium]|nr:hypothetical protein [Actinomycetota bacterium]